MSAEQSPPDPAPIGHAEVMELVAGLAMRRPKVQIYWSVSDHVVVTHNRSQRWVVDRTLARLNIPFDRVDVTHIKVYGRCK